MAEWFKVQLDNPKCLSLFQIIINLSVLRFQHPLRLSEGLPRGREHVVEAAESLSVPHAVSRCHDRATRSWMACAAPATDSGRRENWVIPDSKSHATSQGQSRQTLSRPGLWGCITKGTVPSDGLMLVSSDAHTESGQAFASKLQDHVILFWPATLCIPPLTLSQPCPPTFCLMVINSYGVTLLSAHHIPLRLLALGLPLAWR